MNPGQEGLSGCPQTHADASPPPEVRALIGVDTELERLSALLVDLANCHHPDEPGHLVLHAVAYDVASYLREARTVLRFAASVIAELKGGGR